MSNTVSPRKALLRREARGISGAIHSQRMEAEDANDMIESGKTGEDISAPGGRISSQLWNKDLAPIPRDRRTWGTYNYAALVGGDERQHPHLHAGQRDDRRGNELEAGAGHGFSGQRNCADPDAVERACRRGIRNSVSGFRAFLVWRAGRERSGDSARAGSLRLVRDSNLDWRRSDQHVAGGGAARVGSPLAVLLSFLVVEPGGHSARH